MSSPRGWGMARFHGPFGNIAKQWVEIVVGGNIFLA
jgi:hypothetical protein